MIDNTSEIGLTGPQWRAALETVANNLPSPESTTLCLIGGATCLFAGMEGRSSKDIDVWVPQSVFSSSELSLAAARAGLGFNPRQDDPMFAYIQLVDPGIVQLGEFSPVHLTSVNGLRLTRPPLENLIVSKLLRASSKDLDDIAFLLSCFGSVDRTRVTAITESLPLDKREVVAENLVYLEVLHPSK